MSSKQNPIRRRKRFTQKGGGIRRVRSARTTTSFRRTSRAAAQAATKNLQKVVQARAFQRLQAVVLNRAEVAKANTLRDQALQNRMSAFKEEIAQRRTISEEQQLAMDQMIKDRQLVEDVQFDPALFSQQDATSIQEASKLAARAVLDELRQTAFTQAKNLLTYQTQRLINLTEAERKALFDKRTTDIQKDYAQYERTRELNMLDDVSIEMNRTAIAIQENLVALQAESAEVNSFVLIWKTQTEQAAADVNAATAYIAQNVLQSLYDSQGILDSQTDLLKTIQGLQNQVRALSVELAQRIANIQAKDATVPGLMNLRSALVAQLGPIQMEVNGLLVAITKMPSPSKEAKAVEDALTGLRDDISETARGLYEQYETKVGQTPAKLAAYSAATTARQSAQANYDAAIQTAVNASQLQANQFNADIIRNMEGIAQEQQSARELEGQRDAYKTDSELKAGFAADINTSILPPMRTELETFTRTIFSPAESEYKAALELFNSNQAAIDQFMTLNASEQTRIANIILPALLGGRPIKSAQLLYLESRVPEIKNILDVYFPQAQATAGTLYNGAIFTADSLFQGIAPGSALSTRLKTDSANSSASVGLYDVMVQRLQGLQQTVGQQLIRAGEIVANNATATKELMKDYPEVYMAAFRVQKDFFAARTAQFRGAKVATTRDLTAANNALAVAASLDGKESRMPTILESIRIYDGLITDTKVKASRFTSQKAVVIAEDAATNFTTNTINPQIAVVDGTAGILSENISSRDKLAPSIAPLEAARDTASTNLSNVTTPRNTQRDVLLPAARQALQTNLDSRTSLLQSFKKARISAAGILTGKITFFNGDRNALSSSRIGLVTAKTAARVDASTARDTAVAAGTAIVTVLSPSLDFASSNLATINSDIGKLGALFPTLLDSYRTANTSANIFRNMMTTTSGRLGQYQQDMTIAMAQLDSINIDMNSLITIINFIESGSLTLNIAMPSSAQRDSAKTTLDMVTTARENDDSAIDSLDDAIAEGRAREQQLQMMLLAISTKDKYKQMFQVQIDAYKSARETYRQIRLDRNKDKFQAQISNEAFIATAELFQTAESLSQKTTTVQGINIAPVDTALKAAQDTSATARQQLATMDAVKVEMGARQTVKDVSDKLAAANDAYNKFAEGMPPVTVDPSAITKASQDRDARLLDTAAAFESRQAAEKALGDAQTNRTKLQNLYFLITNFKNIISTKIIQTASKSDLLQRIGFFRTESATAKGATTSSSSAKSQAAKDAAAAKAAVPTINTDSLNQKTLALQAIDTRPVDSAIQDATATRTRATQELATMRSLTVEGAANQLIQDETKKLSDTTDAYTKYLESMPPVTIDPTALAAASQQRDALATDASKAQQARQAAEKALADAQTNRTKLQNLYFLITNFKNIIGTKIIQTASKSDLLQRIGFFRSESSATKGLAGLASSSKTQAAKDATAAKDTVPTGIVDTATSLQTKQTDRQNLQGILKSVEDAARMANYLQDIARGNSTRITLAEFQNQIDILATALSNLQSQIDSSPVAASSIDLRNAVQQLQEMLAALDAARTAQESANQTLFRATRDRESGQTTKGILLDTRDRLNYLADTLNAFSQVINDRLVQKGILGGLAQYYKSMKDQYRQQLEFHRDTKDSDGATAGSLKSPINSSVESVLELARQLEDKGALDASLSARIDQVMSLVNIWSKVRNDSIMQKIANETQTLRSEMEKMLAAQNKLDELNQQMESLNDDIRRTQELLNDPSLSQEQRQELRNRLEQALRTRNELNQQINDLLARIQQMRERILQLLNEINGLRLLLRMARNRLPMFAFVPWSIVIPAVLPIAGIGILGGILAASRGKPKPTDCEDAKTRGYKDGFAQGAKDGYKRGYADAKAQYEKDRNAMLLGNLPTGAEEPVEPEPEPEQEPENNSQRGGAPEDEEPEEEPQQQLYQLPTGYEIPIPDPIPVPSSSEIKVPILPGVTPEYQICYEDGYRRGYKDGFKSTYLKGFKSFVPSQMPFLPPLQEEEEPEEAAPTQADFGYAPPPEEVEEAAPADDRIPVDTIYPVPSNF